MLYRVTVLVGVGAVTVTTFAVVLPLRITIGGGVDVDVVSVVANFDELLVRMYRYKNLPVSVAVVGGAVLVTVTVGQSFVFASVTMRGCGSGARAIMRILLSSTKRIFSSSISRRNLTLFFFANGPTVGLILARGSQVGCRVGYLHEAVVVLVTWAISML